MEEDKNMKSIKIPVAGRTYFFDVKKTGDGSSYLKITESKHIENDAYERHQIVVFEEHLIRFDEAFREVAKEFPSFNKDGNGKSRMQLLKEKFENAYKPWTQEEETSLIDFVRQGKTSKELSVIFRRNVGAIVSRIEKLNLL
jgi:hypothetical protein